MKKNINDLFILVACVKDVQFLTELTNLNITQDAEKGFIFESFPPVLYLQLKRFNYDIQRETMIKVTRLKICVFDEIFFFLPNSYYIRLMIDTSFQWKLI